MSTLWVGRPRSLQPAGVHSVRAMEFRTNIELDVEYDSSLRNKQVRYIKILTEWIPRGWFTWPLFVYTTKYIFGINHVNLLQNMVFFE